jgi:hypothetical protein
VYMCVSVCVCVCMCVCACSCCVYMCVCLYVYMCVQMLPNDDSGGSVLQSTAKRSKNDKVL